MKFCDDHWGQLRDAVKAKGLDALVADTGEAVAAKMADEATRGSTVDNFDPLMGAHNAIVSRAMAEIRDRYTQNPLMVMADDAQHPEWACPICALNWCHVEHNRLCMQENCNWPKQFDWTDEMIGGSTDFMVAQWKRLNA